MRRLIGLIIAMGALATAVSPVAAGAPTRNPLSLPDSITFAAGDACAFPLTVEFVLNREYIKSWTDANGNPIRDAFNGSLWLRLVNDDTGASVDVNAGGPGGNRYNVDGSVTQVFLGHGLPIFSGVFYGTTGNFTYELDAGFNLVEVGAQHGRIIDVCSMIA